MPIIEPSQADVPSACCRISEQQLNPGCTAYNTNPMNVCLAMVPWCKDIWGQLPPLSPQGMPQKIEPQAATGKQLQYTVRQALSKKLYDWYRGIDSPLTYPGGVNLNVAPATPIVSTPVTTPFPQTVCSPVGEKLALSGADLQLGQTPPIFPRISDQFNYALNGSNSLSLPPRIHYTKNFLGTSCGLPPRLGVNANQDLTFDFLQTGNPKPGLLFTSYLTGAYVWAIRAEAYHFLKSVEPDLSNLSALLGDMGIMAADHNSHYNTFKNYYSEMSPIEQAECVDPDFLKREADWILGEHPFCSADHDITDPMQRRCTQAKLSIMASRTGLHFLILKKIMERAKTLQDFYFSSFFNATNNRTLAPAVAALSGRAGQDISKNGHEFLQSLFQDCEQVSVIRSTKGSCAAACILGGAYYPSATGYILNSTSTQDPRRCDIKVHSRFATTTALTAPYFTVVTDLESSRYTGIGISAVIPPAPSPSPSHRYAVVLPQPTPPLPTPTPTPSPSQFWPRSVAYDRSVTFTVLPGIYGVIERVIRVNYCGQKRLDDADNVCDKIDIPAQTLLGGP